MANTSHRPSILSLAESVSALTHSIVCHLKETGQEASNFTASSPEIPTTREYERMRIQLNTAALDLLRLVNGPKVEFRGFITKPYELAAWQVALEFDYFGIVPLEGFISLQELAAKAGMDENRTQRIMRFLATQRVFNERTDSNADGVCFEHTAVSATIAREPLLRDTFSMQMDEMFRASSSASDSIRKSPLESTAEASAFVMRHGEMMYQWYEKRPVQAARFSRAMKGITLRKTPGFNLHR
jgi:hypothetical protein